MPKPSAIVLINGYALAGVESVEVSADLFLGAARFTVNAALCEDNASVWSTCPMIAEVLFSVDGATASLVTGDVDSVSLDPIRGSAALHGRDFAARFFRSQYSGTCQNQRASDIVSEIAERAGLTANVAPTPGLVGRYFQDNRTRSALYQHARATSEWDLMVWLASVVGYQLWVEGFTLNFQPAAQTSPGAVVSPTACMSMSLRRKLDIASGISIEVRSWDCQSQQLISKTASSGEPGAPVSAFVISRPNLATSEAAGLGSSVLAAMTQHHRTVRYVMPGDLTTMPRNVIALQETASDFDGTYEIAQVEREFSMRRGFIQTVEARSLPWTPS